MQEKECRKSEFFQMRIVFNVVVVKFVSVCQGCEDARCGDGISGFSRVQVHNKE